MTKRRRMPADELRAALTHYQQALERERIENNVRVKKYRDDVGGARYWEGQREAFMLALAYLHNWTDGEYGADLDEQRAEDGRDVIETREQT